MRIPSDVAEEIKNIVPEQYKSKFVWHITDGHYKAPEQYSVCFSMLSETCMNIYEEEKENKEEWLFKMLSILSMKDIESIKKELL